MDRISELPESALDHILSFLTFKEVAQLAVLSKKWKHVFLYHPNLTFGNDFFNEHLWADFICSDGKERKYEEAREKIHQLVDVVDRIVTTFHEQKLTINNFELYMVLMNGHDWSSHIDQWIRKVVDSNVKKLRIVLESFGDCSVYTLPNVLVVKSVVTLTIAGCTIAPVTRDFKTDFLSSLKHLHLSRVELSDDHITQNLVANIEILCLVRCKGITNLHISGPVKLKRLILNYNLDLESVYVDTLNVFVAHFGGDSLKVIDVRRCKNLKSIRIVGSMNTAAEWLNEGLNFYPALEKLGLLRCKIPGAAKISSASLKSLELDHCRNLTAIKLNAPNLSEFLYDRAVVTSLKKLPISVSGTHSLHYPDDEES